MLLCGLIAGGAVLGSVSIWLPAAAAARTESQATRGAVSAAAVLDPGTIVALSDPGVELTAAGDGRLRGDGIALIVTGGALTDRAGQGDQTVTAGPGRHLTVFGLRQVPQPKNADLPSAALALVVTLGEDHAHQCVTAIIQARS